MTLQELGQSLKEQREAAGISLEEISTQMKLSVRLLQSIEEGDTLYMPHAVYTKRFIRSLGDVIGYDADELKAQLEVIFPDESIDEETKADPGRLDMETVEYEGISGGGGGKNAFSLIGVIAILAALGVGGWFVVSNFGDDITRIFNKTFGSASQQETQSQAVASQQSAQQAPAAAQRPMQTAALQPSTQVPPAAPVYSPQSLAPTSTPSTPLPAVGSVNQVLIIASEECAIKSRADGARDREYKLRAGESFVVTYTNNLDLSLSNAGGVSLVHNGKNLGRPGNSRNSIDLHFPMPGS